ncbi:MAG: XRE family transcriptional regulator [Pseudomonadota bacterium]
MTRQPMKTHAPTTQTGSAAAPATDRLADLGETLRRLRKARGWSLGRLSEASGVPPSTISKIENLQMAPSLVHAINLASALGENLGFLVDRDARRAADFTLVRTGERAELYLPEMSLTLQDIHGNFEPGLLEARVCVMGRGARSGEEAMTHPGEEVCHVLEGSIRYQIGEGSYVLGEGDTIHFRSDIPHRWQNMADGQTRVVLVFSDGLSF